MSAAEQAVIRQQILRRPDFDMDVSSASSHASPDDFAATARKAFARGSYALLIGACAYGATVPERISAPRADLTLSGRDIGGTLLPSLAPIYGDEASAQSSPFEELYELKRAEAEQAAKARTGHPELDAIADRIATLIAQAVEEYPETALPSAQSIGSTIAFFSKYTNLRAPSLSLTPQGDIWAEWRDGRLKSAAIRFLKNGMLSIAAIYPDSAEPWRRVSLSISCPAHEASNLLGDAGQLRWLRRQA